MYRFIVQTVRGSRSCGMASSVMAHSASGVTTRTVRGTSFSSTTRSKAASLQGNNRCWIGRSMAVGAAIRPGLSGAVPPPSCTPFKKSVQLPASPCRPAPASGGCARARHRPQGGGRRGGGAVALCRQHQAAAVGMAGDGALDRPSLGLRFWDTRGWRLLGTASLVGALGYHALFHRRMGGLRSSHRSGDAYGWDTVYTKERTPTPHMACTDSTLSAADHLLFAIHPDA
jgi:hypothetical protein